MRAATNSRGVPADYFGAIVVDVKGAAVFFCRQYGINAGSPAADPHCQLTLHLLSSCSSNQGLHMGPAGTGGLEAAHVEAGVQQQQPQQQQGSKVRYTKGERVKCSAVLSLAVSPDGSTIAAAVEGEQEVLVLRLDASAGTMTLQQKLAFGDVSNPAAVAFDDEGRLWVVGGVLLLLTESAHVGVAVQQGELPGNVLLMRPLQDVATCVHTTNRALF